MKKAAKKVERVTAAAFENALAEIKSENGQKQKKWKYKSSIITVTALKI